MPIDPSIALQFRGPQIESPVAQFGNVLAIQNAQNQNRLADLQYQTAQRGMERENALAEAYRGAIGPDGKIDRNALLTRLAGGSAASQIPSVQKGFLESDKTGLEIGNIQSQIDERKAKMFREKLGIFGSALAPLAQNPSRQAVEGTLAALKAQGIDAPPIPLPADDALLPQWVRQAAAMTEQGLKALESFAPKVAMTDMGGMIQPTNTNPLAGPIGPLAGAGPMSKTATPDALLTDTRTREEGDKNRGVQIRGQNMTDARARETLAKADKLTEDQGKATGWLVQANNAYENMLAAVKADPSAAKPGFNDVLAAIPSLGFTEGLANTMRGETRQKFIQSASSLSEALLRAATGAGVNKEEAEQKIRELTPRIGDSDAVRKQKMDAIPLYIESLKVRAGPGAAQLPGIVERGKAKATTDPSKMSDAELKKALGL